MSRPLISVVIPTFNQGRYIGQTLASIGAQAWPRLEVIVMDGGSTDETREVVEQWRHLVTTFVSEKDNGQGHAINKGFRLARGEVITWINSDDLHLPLIYERIVAKLGDLAKPHLTYGGCIYMYDGQSRCHGYLAQSHDPERLKVYDYIYQPTAFWTRPLLEAAGGVDESFRFAMDWDYFIRLAQHAPFTPIEDYLAIYRFHREHKTTNGAQARAAELVRIVDKYAGPEWGAAFRDVAEEVDRLGPSLDKLRKLGLYRWRRFVFPALYRKHGDKVKVALSQIRVV